MVKKLVKVAVLLSVYNGERFLREQIDSVLAQEDVAIELQVRDDGSTDGTRAILEHYARHDSRVSISGGNNLGILGSFLTMVQAYDGAADYIALCDADDVWLPRKLVAATEKLEGVVGPALYGCRLRFIDSAGADLGLSRLPIRPLGFQNALVECRITGPTSMFNREAHALLKRYPYAGGVEQDAWVYLVVSAFGQVIFDPEPYLLYRQHGGNATGGTPNAKTRWSRRFSKLSKRVDPFVVQAEYFMKQAGSDLDEPRRAILAAFVAARSSYLARLRFALSPSVFHQWTMSNLYFRLRLLLNR